MLVEVSRVLACLAVGEIASRFSPIALPGPVLGLLVLFAWLCRRGEIPAALGSLADRLLEAFGLLFVPAGVGVMTYQETISSDLLPICAAVFVGTLITIGMTGFIAEGAARNSASS